MYLCVLGKMLLVTDAEHQACKSQELHARFPLSKKNNIILGALGREVWRTAQHGVFKFF